MDPTSRWPRRLIIIGQVFMIAGVLDPLEGSVVILPGAGLAALGAHLGRTRGRTQTAWGFGLVFIGTVALWGMSAVGGLGGDTGRSLWWALTLLPYPAGWIVALGGILKALKKTAPSDPGKA